MAKRRKSGESGPPESKGAQTVTPDSPLGKIGNLTEKTGIPEMISREEIARLAYDLWEKDGRVDGNHQRHWLEAERILHGRGAKKT